MKRVILNRAKRPKISLMINNTHSLEQVEALMWKESDILKDPNVGKERKKEALKKLKLLERHFRDCQDKHINGKHYPIKKIPKDTPKKELLALIDSVPEFPLEESNYYINNIYTEDDIMSSLDTSGTTPDGKRFVFVDKGWDKPKFEHRKV